MPERYIVLRDQMERLVAGIPLRKYSWFRDFKAVETFRIDLDLEAVMCGEDPNNYDCIVAGTTSRGRTFYCDDTEDDHHDIYPLTVMLIRAVGVPVATYYMTQLWGTKFREHGLMDKQLMRVIVGFFVMLAHA